MTHVRLSPLAEADLAEIDAYLSARSPGGAVNVAAAIKASLSLLERFPMIGKPGRVADTRELSVTSYDYIIVYTLPDPFHVDVERLLHGARRWPPDRPD